MKTVAQKMGIKKATRTIFLNATPEIISAMQIPDVSLSPSLNGQFDYIHFFVKTLEECKELFPRLKEHLSLNGMLWVSWPKKKQLGTDLNLSTVIKIGYSYGMVESTCLSIDDIWSGLKFTRPKKGKTYNNSHAELHSRTTNR